MSVGDQNGPKIHAEVTVTVSAQLTSEQIMHLERILQEALNDLARRISETAFESYLTGAVKPGDD